MPCVEPPKPDGVPLIPLRSKLMSTNFISHLGPMALLASTLVAGAQEPGQRERENPELGGVLRFVVESEGEEKHRIGVAVQPHGDKGLLIENVAPDSPAAKAGLKSGDVILAVSDTPIKDYEQLAKLVADSEGKPLELQIGRDNAEQLEKIARYAKGLLNQHDANKDGSLAKDEWANLRRNLQGSDGNKDGVITEAELAQKIASSVDLRLTMSVMVEPIKQAAAGVVIVAANEKQEEENDNDAKASSDTPPSTAATVIASPPGQRTAWRRMTMPGSPAQLPDDMEVRITKKGSEPAVVKVSQGKRSWKTTEDDLSILPPPAQAYAARLLGKGPGSAMPGIPSAPAPNWPGGGPGPGASMVPEAPGGTPAANVRQLPAGGLKFEIREAEERRSSVDKSPQQSERQTEIRRLRDREEALRQAIEELRKRTGESEKE